MTNKPKQTFRAGPCNASVFLNDRKTKDGTVKLPSVAFSCRYHDDESGEWKDASSMSPNEVARAIIVLQHALDYCWLGAGAPRAQKK